MSGFDPIEVRDDLRVVARQLLADKSSPARVRGLLDDPLGYDPGLWRSIADLGWLGLDAPEEYGGAGMGFEELAVVLDEHGRALGGLPLLSSIVLAAAALRVAGTEDLRRRWLTALVTGERRATVAIGPASDRPPADLDVLRPMTMTERGSGWTVSGVARYVPDAVGADGVIVAAMSPEGPTLFLVDADVGGLTVEPISTYDQTRRLATVRAEDVPVGPQDLLGPVGSAGALIGWLLDRAAVALALDSHGGSRQIMELAVEYAKERVQFDRPIGSFQAVKHRCADMLVSVESSRAAVIAAARELSPTPPSDSPWPSIAKSHVTDAYASVAGDAILVLGGVGFTWEHDAHLFLKRAKLSQAWFGTSAWHRARIPGHYRRQDRAASAGPRAPA
jgi:alkylation response protein AidB-like acyl-CoA dehydrogenase